MLFAVIGVVWVYVVAAFAGAGLQVHVVTGERNAQCYGFGVGQGEGLHLVIFALPH